MNTNHLDTVRAIYEAFSKGDIPTILSHLDDDVQWEAWANNSAQKHNVPWMQPGMGKEAVMAFFGVVAQSNVIDFQVLSMMGGRNQVAVETVIETGSSALGTGYRDEEIHLWTFNEAGKAVRLRHYTDTYKHIQTIKA